jgi:hypothetical protein
MPAFAPGADSGSSTAPQSTRREALGVLLIGLALLAFAAYRARLGVSFYDDSHYVAVSLRIANGARPIADEMSLQSLGFLVPAAFAWLWTHTVGMTGLVLAFRLLYVVLAVGAGAVVYRALRGSFRPAVAGLAALIPLACPPFNLIAPSYNTVAMLGFMVAFALSFSAWRSGGRVAPLFAGAAMAFMSVSYPPLTIAALTLFVTLVLTSRDWRVARWVALGAAVTLALVVAPLVALVSLADLQRSLAYAAANVHGFGSPLVKLGYAVGAVVLALVVPGLIPLWLLVVAACVRRLPRAAKVAVLLAVPAAATIPGLLWLASASRRALFGNTAASWLITFTIAAVVPVALWARREDRIEIRRLLRLAVPCSVVGFTIVSYSTDASLVRAVSVIGIVPLGMVVLLGWATMVEELGGALALTAGWLLVAASVVVLLFTTTIDDRRPLMLHSGVNYGPFAFMRMSPNRRDELLAVQSAGQKYVRPSDRVTFLGERNGYLLVGGHPYTNAVWLYVGSSDAAALDYFSRHGGMPDVVFVDHMALVKEQQPTYQSAAKTDPMLRRVLAEYRLAETVADFGVFVRR